MLNRIEMQIKADNETTVADLKEIFKQGMPERCIQQYIRILCRRRITTKFCQYVSLKNRLEV